MAIARVSYPSALPLGVADYQAQNALLYAAFLYMQHPVPVVAGNIVKGAMFNVGGTVYQATGDTAITGTPSAYVKLTPGGGGATLAPSYVANLAGVAWNDTYAGYYDGGSNLYVFDEGLAVQAGALVAPFYRRIVERDENGNIGRVPTLLVTTNAASAPAACELVGKMFWEVTAAGATIQDFSLGASATGVQVTVYVSGAGACTVKLSGALTVVVPRYSQIVITWNGSAWLATGGWQGETVRITAGAGNWTVPAGVYKVRVTCVGGGGGGGDGTVNAAGGGGGGGGGGTNISLVTGSVLAVVPGQVIAYSVGAGGAATVAGTQTSFAGATSGPGGGAGGNGAADVGGAAGLGAAGGAGSAGGTGGHGTGTRGGSGGSGGGAGGRGDNGGANVTVGNYGGGGGGGFGGTVASGNGAAGGSGIIIIEY